MAHANIEEPLCTALSTAASEAEQHWILATLAMMSCADMESRARQVPIAVPLLGALLQERSTSAETLTLVTLSLTILSGSKPGQFAIAVEPKAFDTLLDIAISTADDRLGQFATSLRAECARYARWALHMPLDAPRPTPEPP